MKRLLRFLRIGHVPSLGDKVWWFGRRFTVRGILHEQDPIGERITVVMERR